MPITDAHDPLRLVPGTGTHGPSAFRTVWSIVTELNQEPDNILNTERFDALWEDQRSVVLAVYDKARYTFTLESDGLRTGPQDIPVQRDPNYRHHLLQFPASGRGPWFERYRQGWVMRGEHLARSHSDSIPNSHPKKM